jgi:hypothetical protein
MNIIKLGIISNYGIDAWNSLNELFANDVEEFQKFLFQSEFSSIYLKDMLDRKRLCYYCLVKQHLCCACKDRCTFIDNYELELSVTKKYSHT